MSPGSPITYFAGFDWAKHSHQVVIVNAAGQIETEFRFEHTEAGWQHWRRQATQFAPLAVAVESESRHRHRPTASDARLHDLSTQSQSGSRLPRAQSSERHQE